MKSILALTAVSLLPVSAQVTITSTNRLAIARPGQTIELTADWLAPLAATELAMVHVKDAAGRELACQAVDTDGDALCRPDIVIFQADFAANETKTFTATAGARQVYTKEQYKAFGRFVRERFDDFAWENDRIAHRTYGKALETWEGEPLSSSTIDIWSKRTPRMVVNDWYLSDDYHADHGEGADFYSAGAARGCGGNGLWADDRLWTSGNFIKSRVLANGPIRVMFELTYDTFNVNGISVTEVKRVTLDAGSQFDHFQSIYKQFTRPGQTQTLTTGIGLKKNPGERKEVNAAEGWMVKWEAVAKNNGSQGLAVIVDPKLWQKDTEDKLNHLVLASTPDDTASYWAGFCWDKAGLFTSLDAWKNHVAEFAQGLASPIDTRVVK